MRTRPPTGRRLWRRRRRRPEEGASTAGGAVEAHGTRDDAHDDAHDAHGDHDDDRQGQDVARVDDVAPAAPVGFWQRLFRRSPPPPPATPDVDHVRMVLQVPRGPARLDAFERTLARLSTGTADHRRLAVAFHDELVGLARQAGVDLQLFEARVASCARALIAAGEDEKAGGLYARLGRRHQAAELFVKAGAIDKLEEQHAELAFDEGGARLDARLSFERFEALFLVGLRDDALAALERAVALWDNPVYGEVLAGFRARIPPPGRLVLSTGDDVVRVIGGLPVVLGRGEDSAVRIDSPLVSRAHLELYLGDGGVMARDLAGSGASRVDDHDAGAATRLRAMGTLQLASVVLAYDLSPARLLLRTRLAPRHVTLVALSDIVADPLIGSPLALAGGRARLVADSRARLNGEPLRRDALLLVGDRVGIDERTWTVAAR